MWVGSSISVRLDFQSVLELWDDHLGLRRSRSCIPSVHRLLYFGSPSDGPFALFTIFLCMRPWDCRYCGSSLSNGEIPTPDGEIVWCHVYCLCIPADVSWWIWPIVSFFFIHDAKLEYLLTIDETGYSVLAKNQFPRTLMVWVEIFKQWVCVASMFIS